MSGTEIKAAVGSKRAQRHGCSLACLYSAPSTSKPLLDRYFQFLTASPSWFFPIELWRKKQNFRGQQWLKGTKSISGLVKAKKEGLGDKRRQEAQKRFKPQHKQSTEGGIPGKWML